MSTENSEIHSRSALQNLRIAVVHEWFVNHAGSEKVVEQLLHVFPKADLFSLVDFLPDNQRFYLQGKKPKTTFIQSLPFARKSFRSYLPLFPLAVESHDLRDYDLIISSSHLVSKGVLVREDQLHICYCHSPCRFAWDLYHQYLEEAGLQQGIKGRIAQYFLHKLRIWDQISTPRVGHFLANSAYIARRIGHVYGREAEVIYPPVDVEKFQPGTQKGDYFFAASRLVPYKKMELIVRAFSRMPEHKLILVGSGPDENRISALLTSNIEFRKEANQADFQDLMANAKAFVFAAEEDFGITMAEALACGTPVLAYKKGGASEIVLSGQNGYLFELQTPESLIEQVQVFTKNGVSMDSDSIRKSADRFSIQRFRDEISNYIGQKWIQKTQ